MIKFSNCLLNLEDNNNYREQKSIMIESASERSYNDMMYDMLLENHNQYVSASKDLYKSLTEAGSYRVINEGFSEFFGAIKKIVDKFIQFIKKLFAKFVTGIKRLMKNKQYLKDNKQLFYKFKEADAFDFSGYTFTFNSAVPYVNPLAQYDSEFIGLSDDDLDTGNVAIANSDKNVDKSELIVKALADKRAKLTAELDNKFYDELRYNILHPDSSGGTIDESDWSDDLFTIFRNGDDKPETINVDPTFVNETFILFSTIDKMIKDTEKLKNKIEKDYREIERKVSKMITKSTNKETNKITYSIDDGYDGFTGNAIMTDKMATQVDMILKLRSTQIEKMSIIHGTAFAAKLTALDSASSQCVTILYKVLQKVQKLKGDE